MKHIIVNPNGASGKTMKLLKKVERILEEKNIEYEVHLSRLDFNVGEIIAALEEREAVVDVLLIGGDGTLNHFINGMKDFTKVRLGLLPCGSGNDFALSLGIGKDVKKEVEKILEGKVRRQLDVGEVEYYNQFDEENRPIEIEKKWRFNNACGIGYDAEICQKAEKKNMRKLKKLLNYVGLGKLIYLIVGMKLVHTLEQLQCTIRLDNEKIKQFNRIWFAAVMNEPYEGGGFKFGADAKADDGMFDICIADSLNTIDFFKIFPYAYSGKHVKFEGVHMLKGKEIDIEVEKPMWIHTDGEFACQSSHICVRFLEEKLQMLN